METISLKALANKVLQRNSQGIFVETGYKIDGNSQSQHGFKAYKVYSEILQAYLWVVDTDQYRHSLRSQGISEGIYTADEITKLKGMDKDALREIHKIKEVFPESSILDIRINGGE